MSVSEEGFRRENSGNTPQLALGIIFRAFRLASNCEHAPRSSDWEREKERERWRSYKQHYKEMQCKVCLNLNLQQDTEERARERDRGGGGDGAQQEAASGLKQVKAWVFKISHKKAFWSNNSSLAFRLKVYETMIFLCIQLYLLNNGRRFIVNALAYFFFAIIPDGSK